MLGLQGLGGPSAVGHCTAPRATQRRGLDAVVPRSLGFATEASASLGVRLGALFDFLLPRNLRSRLLCRLLGVRCRHLLAGSLGLETMGVELARNGDVPVDGQLQTVDGAFLLLDLLVVRSRCWT